jgi:hypothetical protein
MWHFGPNTSQGLYLRGFAITLRHTTVVSTPLHEWSARRRDLYLTTPNTHYRQTDMFSSGFEPTIPAYERRRTARPLESPFLWLLKNNSIKTHCSGGRTAWILTNFSNAWLNIFISVVPKGRFTHSMPCPCRAHAVPMPCPCRAHAVPMPCRAAKGLECDFPIWFTECGRFWFTLSMPCPCRAYAMLWPRRSSQGHATARPSRDGLWATCPHSASSSYQAEFHEDCYQKHISPPHNDPYLRL